MLVEKILDELRNEHVYFITAFCKLTHGRSMNSCKFIMNENTKLSLLIANYEFYYDLKKDLWLLAHVVHL